MKKLILLSAVLLLVGCSKQESTTDEVIQETPSSIITATQVPTAEPIVETTSSPKSIDSEELTDAKIFELLGQYQAIDTYMVNVLEKDTDDYITDDNGNHFEHVTNFNSYEEVKEYIATFTIGDFWENLLFEQCFKEESGKLYHCPPQMGYHSYDLSAGFSKIDSTTVQVPYFSGDCDMESCGVDAIAGYYEITFGQDNEEWKISGATQIANS